ncbi:MAG TPA: hypothetical protein PKD98_29320 [Anaerolineae bacterium]|nr:hypothetical protein [Anaerolineae bacterium]
MVLLWLTGCRAAEPLPPAEAQEILRQLWQTDRHAVWEIDSPAIPIGGPLVVETWQQGDRYRYEILESTAPALAGETLVFDGQLAWPYNRFDPPPAFEPGLPALAPVTETFDLIEHLLTTPAAEASQSTARLNFQPAHLITLTYPNGDTLAMWRAETGALPVKVEFSLAGQAGELLAREIEPLGDAPPALFEVGEWLISRP